MPRRSMGLVHACFGTNLQNTVYFSDTGRLLILLQRIFQTELAFQLKVSLGQTCAADPGDLALTRMRGRLTPSSALQARWMASR